IVPSVPPTPGSRHACKVRRGLYHRYVEPPVGVSACCLRQLVSTLRLAPSLVSPPPRSARRLLSISAKSSWSLPTSVEPDRRKQRILMRCTARPEREKLKC